MKRTIFGIFAVLVMVGCFTAASMAGEPIKLGALYNLTGGMSSIDAPALNGAKLQAKLINESGGLLGGRMLEVIGIP
jgi:branched-chain amino acid transport system substrate-binding protein